MPTDETPPRWTSSEDTILESLLTIADAPDDDEDEADDDDDDHNQATPWQPGHELLFSSYGGQRSLERRRVSIASSRYSNRVTGNLDMKISRNFSQTFEGDSSLTLAAPPEPETPPPEDESEDESGGESGGESEGSTIGRLLEDAPVTTGMDKLHVQGNADFNVNNRQYLMTGFVDRLWYGGITKFCGMEGVICGGLSLVTHTGPSLQISLIASGDVYGGAARVSAARINIGALTYRSGDGMVWAMGYWGRFATFVIVPPIAPEGVGDSKLKKGAKWALKLTGAILPFFEIASGLFSVLLLPFKLLLSLLMKIRAVRKLKSQVMQRIKNLIAGVKTRMTSSELST